MRDTQLDIYRALSIMYVIGIIHVMYWLGYGNEPWLSILLFEMPAIFFISGAAVSFTPSSRPLWTTVKSRFARVILPFYIYAVVVVVFMTVLSIIAVVAGKYLGTSITTYISFDISWFSWHRLLKVLLCEQVEVSPYSWHLWFIVPYFVLSVVFSLEARLLCKMNKYINVLLSLLMFVLFYRLLPNTLIHTVSAYNVFMVVGYSFYKKTTIKEHLLLMMSVGVLCFTLYLLGYSFVPMQDNKFPPNPMFVSYGMLAVCGLALFFRFVTLRENLILHAFAEKGYTIYLYQNLVFYFVAPILKIASTHIENAKILMTGGGVRRTYCVTNNKSNNV